MRSVCASLMAVGALLRAAPAATLGELLAAVADNARFETPARADVTIACSPDCAPPTTHAVFVGRGDALYVEVKDGQRALLTSAGITVARDGAGAPAKPGETFAGTDVLLEDLVPFTAASLKMPLISDDGPAGVVVTAAPAHASAYVLIVHTIDAASRAIARTQLYQNSIGNLTRIVRNGAWTEVGGHRRPGEIALENVRKGFTTRLTLDWHETPDAPAALFEPGGLTKPSALAP